MGWSFINTALTNISVGSCVRVMIHRRGADSVHGTQTPPVARSGFNVQSCPCEICIYTVVLYT